jgi:hypothetical protein
MKNHHQTRGLRNESFKRFVLATFGAKDLAEAAPGQNQAPPLLSWRSLRVPIGVAITASAMFLFATQKEFWQLAIGLAASFATASQSLSKITSVFGKSNTGDAGAEGESG